MPLSFQDKIAHFFLHSTFDHRRQSGDFLSIDLNDEPIEEMLLDLSKCPRKYVSHAIFIVSTIANISPDDIFSNVIIPLSINERETIASLICTLYRPQFTVSIELDGQLCYTEQRPFFPNNFASTISQLNCQSFPEITIDPQATDHQIVVDVTDSHYFYSEDLSNGFNPQHNLPPILCFNDIDDQSPTVIRWVSSLNFSVGPDQPYEGQCDCKHIHGNSLFYQPDGRIDIRDLQTHDHVIYECGPNCPFNSPNRIVQHGWKWKFSICRSTSPSKWGVRTEEFIPVGSFVTEYLGRLVDQEDAANNYLVNEGNHLPNLDAGHVAIQHMLLIKSHDFGNISSYIEESSDEANLVPISIFTSESPQRHRIAFFALRDIFPTEFLYYHPNYGFDFIQGLNELAQKEAQSNSHSDCNVSDDDPVYENVFRLSDED